MPPHPSTTGTVVSVSRSPIHGFSKDPVAEINILANHGVEGDAHAGPLVQHLYRVRKNPKAPNLCQVHLLPEELFAELRAEGLEVAPGQMGENITVRGLNLIDLPVGALVHLGSTAVVEITGLRDPCNQLNGLRKGLMKACFARDADGTLLRKAGVMATAKVSGPVRPGDLITIHHPPHPWTKMTPV
ncbi:MOSC domain-containing protein [Granulicella tundricola]|uniref:MOSC domain containing protein n=1 Tax=Granulicella tundricola (strain ATCC BAA-1859 / DSM 23138 / MP5ACTX9) TaxID=1198114 RepID=E8WVL1_GRATM|nr:MOSC domain-containing protein [Granulicella tundricola]ADW69540.1 MOSC domain containing protein [Granulicella tundricola MP5ACTX9]